MKTEIIRTGVQIRVWPKGLKHKLLGLEFSSEYTLEFSSEYGRECSSALEKSGVEN
jgi:hypothetical protein